VTWDSAAGRVNDRNVDKAKQKLVQAGERIDKEIKRK
jgi:hypothetical protein